MAKLFGITTTTGNCWRSPHHPFGMKRVWLEGLEWYLFVKFSFISNSTLNQQLSCLKS